jgi:hypothetical protein
MRVCNKRHSFTLGTVAQTVGAAMRCVGVAFACLIFCFQPSVAIVGGASDRYVSPRYHVVLIEDSNKVSCTGTALTQELVLTAAQCLRPGREYKIMSVDSDRLSIPIRVTRVELHPDFDMQAYLHSRATADLAILKLAIPLPLAIAAPLLGNTVAVGEQIIIIGYGISEYRNSNSHGTLRAASLVVTGKPNLSQIRLADPACQSSHSWGQRQPRCMRRRLRRTRNSRDWWTAYWCCSLVDRAG